MPLSLGMDEVKRVLGQKQAGARSGFGRRDEFSDLALRTTALAQNRPCRYFKKVFVSWNRNVLNALFVNLDSLCSVIKRVPELTKLINKVRPWYR